MNNNLKKFILAIVVVVAFIGYAVYQKFGWNFGEDDGEEGRLITTNKPSMPNVPLTPTTTSVGKYKDGVYTGVSYPNNYGNVQVEVTVSNGKITAVKFLDHPQSRETSIQINVQAMPMLEQEAIAAQSAQVDGVSGASETSRAFIQSLSSALIQAL
jgi:uncharacterized protein with FMN-binding domain